jgi:hypothetical protein
MGTARDTRRTGRSSEVSVRACRTVIIAVGVALTGCSPSQAAAPRCSKRRPRGPTGSTGRMTKGTLAPYRSAPRTRSIAADHELAVEHHAPAELRLHRGDDLGEEPVSERCCRDWSTTLPRGCRNARHLNPPIFGSNAQRPSGRGSSRRRAGRHQRGPRSATRSARPPTRATEAPITGRWPVPDAAPATRLPGSEGATGG